MLRFHASRPAKRDILRVISPSIQVVHAFIKREFMDCGTLCLGSKQHSFNSCSLGKIPWPFFLELPVSEALGKGFPSCSGWYWQLDQSTVGITITRALEHSSFSRGPNPRVSLKGRGIPHSRYQANHLIYLYCHMEYAQPHPSDRTLQALCKGASALPLVLRVQFIGMLLYVHIEGS